MDDFGIDGDLFQVLINDEGQHSLYPAAQDPPDGWKRIGPTGTKAECVAYVDANWLDMRPRTLQNGQNTVQKT